LVSPELESTEQVFPRQFYRPGQFYPSEEMEPTKRSVCPIQKRRMMEPTVCPIQKRRKLILKCLEAILAT